MLTTLKAWFIRNRIAAISIARDNAERQRASIEAKLEQLAQREIAARIDYSRALPLPHTRHIINLPQ
jgi:hypothetical protein